MSNEPVANHSNPESIQKKEPSPAYLFGIPVVATLALLIWQANTYINNYSSNEAIPKDADRVSSESSPVTIDVVPGSRLLIETPANTHLMENSVASMCEGLTPSDSVAEKDCIAKFDDLTDLHLVFDQRDQVDQIELKVITNDDGKPMIHLGGTSTIPLNETILALENIPTYQTRSKKDMQNLFTKTAILTGSVVSILTLTYLNRQLRTRKPKEKPSKSKRGWVTLTPFENNPPLPTINEESRIDTTKKHTTHQPREERISTPSSPEIELSPYWQKALALSPGKHSANEVATKLTLTRQFQKAKKEAEKKLEIIIDQYNHTPGFGTDVHEIYRREWDPNLIYLKALEEIRLGAIEKPESMDEPTYTNTIYRVFAEAIKRLAESQAIFENRTKFNEHQEKWFNKK